MWFGVNGRALLQEVTKLSGLVEDGDIPEGEELRDFVGIPIENLDVEKKLESTARDDCRELEVTGICEGAKST